MARRKTIAKKSLGGTRKSSLRNRTANKRRKGFLAVALPWARRFGLVLGAVVFTVWAGAWLWLNGSVERAGDWGQDQMVEASASLGFRVENILVEGRVHSDPDIILAIVNTQKNDPLFSFDPREAKDSLERLSWVDTARVQRRWPDTIYIDLQERKPLALWQKDKQLFLLDHKGEVINTDRLHRFKDLVVVMGDGAPAHIGALVADLKAEEALHGRVKTAKWVSKRRWDITTKDNITVKLPEEDVTLSLRRLADAQAESALLDKDIMGIDLREHDRITVRTKPGSVQEYKASLKSGNNI